MIREKVLVVEDEPVARFGLRDFLAARGFDVQEAASLAQARGSFQLDRPDAVVVDYSLPDGNALDLLAEIRSVDQQLPVIVLTGHGTIDLAVRAIKEGAENFLTKPMELPVLAIVLERALENQRNRRRQAARQSQRSREEVDPFAGGSSAALRELSREAAMALRSEGPVLIQGETGSGKGVLAAWLHDQGARRDGPFVDLNCAGLSREFLESELFGHARGAFTGAVSEKKGLFEVAHRGTLFLDEIGDLDPTVQPKVLKVIEDKRFRRLGEVAERQVDVFLIAASNQDLASLVRDGKFRSDLFFRINTILLAVPPLRERREDIAPFALRLLERLGRDLGRPGGHLVPDALEALRSYSWPGNLRELRNVLERAVLRADGREIRPSDFRFSSLPGEGLAAGVGQLPTGLTLAELEKQQIERVLQEEGGRVVNAARRLGIPRSTLYQKIKELRVDRSRLQG
jgi:DNA-binding NtrC family response regulator